mmetsp:Transcript_11860/g.27006  ORF Transcript_11860/g.27006 Transcript_11860/m.27006 type:complete len:438 (+) Transcript_11860:53-1366(+)
MSAVAGPPDAPEKRKALGGRFRRLSVAVAATVGVFRRGSQSSKTKGEKGEPERQRSRTKSITDAVLSPLTSLKRKWRRGSTDNASEPSMDDSDYSENYDEDDDDDGPRYGTASESVPVMGHPDEGSLLKSRLQDDLPGEVSDDEDQRHLDWDDELTEDDFEALEAALGRLQPKCRPPAELIVDTNLRSQVKARLNPARHFNATLAFGATGPRSEFSVSFTEPKAKAAPRVILVSGHSGLGGNIALNGVYERYPSDYHGRAVYQKVMEKRVEQDPMATPEEISSELDEDELRIPAWRRVKRTPLEKFVDRRQEQMLRSQAGLAMTRAAMQGKEMDARTTCIISRAGYQTMQLPKPTGATQQGDASLVVDTLANRWFLFFDRLHGWWCIGAKPGAAQVIARCGGATELCPHGLKNWEVWDVGLCQWRRHARLRTIKGGY